MPSAEYQREWAERNPDKVAEYRRRRREDPVLASKRREQSKLWWEKLKSDPVEWQKFLQRRRERRQANLQAAREADARHYRANAEKRAERQRLDNIAHPEKYAEKRRRWKEKHPGHWRRRLLKKYGISEDEYFKRLDEQNGRCGICRDPVADSRGQHLHVDHDHADGAVRGLLCVRCNTRLDWFEKYAEEAAAYLNRHALRTKEV